MSSTEYFCGRLAANIDEKVLSDAVVGTGFVTEIGRCIEKKEATCISAVQLVGFRMVWYENMPSG